MFWFMAFATGVPHDAAVAPVELYLIGIDAPLSDITFNSFESLHPENALSMTSGQLFSQRLATLLNTVWQASLAPDSLTLGAAANYSANSTEDGYFPSASTATKITQEISIYAANYVFISFLLMIALILQLCAIAGLILKYTATAPDVLGYISTMTTDNQHTKVPPGGNTLDGLERARYLYSMKVQLADVKKNQVNGHLAFRSVNDDAEFAEGKLSKEKLYV